MKKFITVFGLLAVSALALTGCGKSKETLKIYNAGEYIDTSLISKFEKENKCKVVYETFDSNETMYTKIMSGENYDVLVPSDYMIERLIKEDKLEKIDWDKITNKDNLNPDTLGQAYDPNQEYAVPYFYGTVGILYDTTVVDEKDLADGWNLLNNTKYKDNIYMYDSERDSFMIALKALGYSMNTDKKSQLDEAYNWLIDQQKTMKPVYVGDDVMDNMISGNKDMAVVYSGDGAYIISENENMGFFVPNQGSNVWIDAMIITKNCKNTELAHKYINYFLQEDVALENTRYIGYDSGVKSVYEHFRDDEYKGNPACAPDTSNEKNEEFKDRKQDIKEYCASLWTKVKSH